MKEYWIKIKYFLIFLRNIKSKLHKNKIIQNHQDKPLIKLLSSNNKDFFHLLLIHLHLNLVILLH